MNPEFRVHFSDQAVPMDALKERAYNLRWATLEKGTIALTAADPDFAVAPPIQKALKDYIDSGVFSYGPSEGLPEFRAACAETTARRKGFMCSPEQILAVDSAAAGMMHIARMTLGPGDEAIIFDPVDFLFKASVEAAGGKVKLLAVDPDSGQFDLDSLGKLLSPRTRLIGVCNPHNPVGRVLTRKELRVIGEFAVEHDLWILNDEIWSDIVYDRSSFTSLPSISPEIAARTFTVHGFSKTFGLAGLRIGFVIAPDAEGFERLIEISQARTTMTGASTLSQIAATAAYRECWDWADAFVDHLRDQRDLAHARLIGIPGLTCLKPEGTYVLFPSIKALGKPTEEIVQILLTEGKVAVVPGAARWFGPGAEGRLRIVLSTSRGILNEGLNRIETTLNRIREK